MGKTNKIIDAILRGGSDANISFDDLIAAVRSLGLAERRGNHPFIFTGRDPAGGSVFLNLQPDRSGKAKPYQVKQVRRLIEQISNPKQSP